MDKNNWHPQTKAVRMRSSQTQHMEHSAPMYLTSSFTFEDAETMRGAFTEENDSNIYSRYSNPTVDEFVEKISSKVMPTPPNYREIISINKGENPPKSSLSETFDLEMGPNRCSILM